MGRKPVRGGRPPSDSKIRGRRAVRAGAVVQAVDREFTVVVFVIFRVRKAAEVMAM